MKNEKILPFANETKKLKDDFKKILFWGVFIMPRFFYALKKLFEKFPSI